MGIASYRRRLQQASVLTPALLTGLTFAVPALANPLDGNVVAGQATISNPDTTTLQIDQTTDKAIVEWKSFNIDAGETTVFVQPSSDAWTLNRVVGSNDPSRIFGTLKANGNIVLVNPDGIHFGAGSTVDVNRLIASTADIENDNFLNGNFVFDQPGNPAGSVVNEGTITIKDYGLSALVAPAVRNSGVITARLGNLNLASGNVFTIDPYGDGLIKLAIDDEIQAEVFDVATGQPISDLVKNDGALSANGGVVALSAATARRAVNSVINNTGVIEANSVSRRGGKIILGARTQSSKTADAPTQVVRVSGQLSALSIDDIPTPTPAPRGYIEITGEAILATEATIDTSGIYGGGTVLIGGDYLGGQADQATLNQYGISYEERQVATADLVVLDETVSVHADAIGTGDGGKVVVWSDGSAVSAAEITARGGQHGGNGGFIETSGHYLDVRRAADASAPYGNAGTWLLDPYDLFVRDATSSNYDYYYTSMHGFAWYGWKYYPTAESSVISTSVIEAAINAGNNVQINTSDHWHDGDEAGNIYIEDDITKTAGGDVFLTFDSINNVIISSGVDITSTSGALNVGLFAAYGGQVIGSGVGVFDLNGGWLRIAASDGVDFHSTGNMPDSFILDLFPDGDPTRSNVFFAITFDEDVIKFQHDNETATVNTGGIQLVDSGGGDLFVYAGDLNFRYFDRAITVEHERDWRINTGGTFGAYARNALNGIPEVISDGQVYFYEADSDFKGAVSVVEVRAAKGVVDSNSRYCFGLTCVITGPGGEAALDEYLYPGAFEVEQSLIDPEAGVETIADPDTDLCSVDSQLCVPPDTGNTDDVSQELIDEVKQSYGTSKDALRQMELIAENADYALLSGAAYGQGGRTPAGWTAIGGIETIDGMSATLFENESSGEVVVSFRGTVNSPKSLSELNWATNNSLMTGVNVNNIPAMQSALTYAKSILKQYDNVRFTGHSLGGAMAQYAAAELGINAVTFNAAPLAGSLAAAKSNVPFAGSQYAVVALPLLVKPLPNFDNIVNFRSPKDFVTSPVANAATDVHGQGYVGREPIVVENIKTRSNNHSIDVLSDAMINVKNVISKTQWLIIFLY